MGFGDGVWLGGERSVDTRVWDCMVNKEYEPATVSVAGSVFANCGVAGKLWSSVVAVEFGFLYSCDMDVLVLEEVGEFGCFVLDAIDVELKDVELVFAALFR